MAVLIEINNPFQPLKDSKRHEHKGGITIRGWLEKTYPGFREFAHPTFCTVNGEAKLRAEWTTYQIAEEDVVNFIVVPGDPYTVLYILYAVLVVAAVAIALSIPVPGEPGKNNPDAVYDLRGQRNQNRLSSPIEVPYGRCRLFPSYAARSYNVYEGNKQYQFNLFCVGQGSFELDEPQYEDTPVSDFQDIEFEVYEPGEPSTMFPDNVVTSAEVAGIELFGTNEPDYAIVGGFSANEPGTLAYKLQVDVSFPLGLYLAAKDGTLGYFTARVKFEYRQIDDAGDPVGAGTWLTLQDFSVTRKTSTPQRFTLELEVDDGRYEVRALRIGDHDQRPNIGNTIRWDGLRAFLPSTQDFGNVTRIAVKALASNNLNDNSSQRFNVWGTRKLRKWDIDSQAWLPIAATRNPVWAFCDVFQAAYGGQLADNFLALDDLAAFAATFESESRYFDYVFDQPATCWDAAQVIARVARCTRMLNGPQITLVRDLPRTVPTAVFTPSNMLDGSFNWEIKMIKEGEYDGVLIEYIDPVTWKPETIECLVGDDVGDNLESIKLLGCTNRDYAYQEGIYIRKQRRLLRENIVFQTGLEGHIPAYGDLIRIAHDLPRWSTSGLVVSISGTTVVLNEPVEFAGTCVIGFRNKDGTESGPHACTAGANANTIILGAPLSESFFFDGVHELPMFLFGPLASFGKLCTVTNLTPSEGEGVEVRAVVYADVYGFGDTPEPVVTTHPHTPTIPVLLCDTLTASWEPSPADKVRIAWAPALGAIGYKVEISRDGTDWDEIARTDLLFVLLDWISGQDLNYRVTALGAGSIVGNTCTHVETDFGPPLGPIVYYDDIPVPVYPTSVTHFHKEKANYWAIRGINEFIPSSPPKKYKRMTYAGTTTRRTFGTPGDGGCGTLTASDPYTLSGAWTWDVETDTQATAGVATDNSGSTPFTGHTLPNYFIGICGLSTITTARLSRQVTNPGECCARITSSYGGILYSTTDTGVLSAVLSEEDTKEAAIARMLASTDFPTDWLACSSFPCGETALIPQGATGLGPSFPFHGFLSQGYYREIAAGLPEETETIATVRFKRTAAAGGAIDFFTMDYTLTTDSDGNAELEIEIPAEEGFSISVNEPASYKVDEDLSDPDNPDTED